MRPFATELEFDDSVTTASILMVGAKFFRMWKRVNYFIVPISVEHIPRVAHLGTGTRYR